MTKREKNLEKNNTKTMKTKCNENEEKENERTSERTSPPFSPCTFSLLKMIANEKRKEEIKDTLSPPVRRKSKWFKCMWKPGASDESSHEGVAFVSACAYFFHC